MKKTAVQQTTFQGGMLEGIKQDVLFEAGGGALTSVLWLENYNHTLQQDSAIKRWGEVDSGVPLLDLGYFTPNMTYSYVVNGGNTLEIDRSTWLQGVQMYSVVHPEYNNNYTTFLKRYPNTTATYAYDYVPDYIRNAAVLHTVEASEAVAVVSHTIAKDGDTAQWQEVWADGVTDYPGWYAFGTLADVARYGETLLFTTTLNDLPYFETDGTKNPVNDYLYPVYRYLYWDITKKWTGENQYLNGITDYNSVNITDDKFHHWKVLLPAQYIVNNIDVGITAGILDPAGATLDHGGAGSTNDINICIEECNLMGYKHSALTFPQAIQTLVYYPAWLDEVYKQFTGGDVNVTKSYLPSATITSLEDTKLNSMNLIMYATGYEDGYVNYYSHIPGLDVNRVIYRKKSFDISVLNQQYTIDTNYGTGVYYTVDPNGLIVGTILSKYTESRSPRMFMYGERFDFVLTASISGVEVVLYRGQYTVQQEPDAPDSFLSFYYDNLPYTQYKEAQDISAYTIDSATGEYNNLTYHLGNMVPQARSLGTVTSGRNQYHVYGRLIYFTIEVKKETMQLLVDSSCSALSLWCIKPDSNEHIIKSIGSSVDSPTGNVYNRPLEQSNEVIDYTKYALLKKFVIDGRTEAPANYENWVPSATLATNSWYERSDGVDTWYAAVPLNFGSPLGPTNYIPVYPTDAEVIDYLDGTSSDLDTYYWTPDFVIWDYPTETTLFLNSSGKYWKGLGAKLITVIKGRTFIGGCIGADGIEEQAILRYSDVQGGAISPDIFSEERKIQVGHIPHTALLEFREQLWAFSRYQFYRIGMASITQEETWEFFDVVEQGCFNVKSAIVVPYGVCFCNEAGVWLSEGGEPQNLALPILPTYQNISSGTNYLYTNINELAGVPYIDSKGINPYLELNYDSFNDEILVSSPLFTTVQNDTDYLPNTDFTMIFSFKYKTWRIESSAVPQYEVEIQ